MNHFAACGLASALHDASGKPQAAKQKGGYPMTMTNRRCFLKVGAAGILGLNLADVLRLEAQTAARGRQRARGVILV